MPVVAEQARMVERAQAVVYSKARLGQSSESLATSVRWNLADLQRAGVLLPGHTYRFYVMVHDGDQNKTGGDAGQAAFNYFYSGPVGAQQPASIAGYVYADMNFNGVRDAWEVGIGGVTVILSGTDAQGHAVNLTTNTDASGAYNFTGLSGGTYSLSRIAPGMMDIGANIGSVGGNTDGSVLGTSIGSINLNDGDQGINYNFGEFIGS